MTTTTIIVTLTGLLATAVVVAVVWLLTRHQAEQEEDARWSVHHELRRWAARAGWTMTDEPDPDLLGAFDPRHRPGHEVLAAAAGELAGRPACLLLGKDDDEDGAPRYAVLTLRMPAPTPALQVQQRYVAATLWRAQDPAPPDPSAGDRAFHRQVRIGQDTDPALLTDPVRAALLRLAVLGYGKREFVDLRDGTLRVLLAGWPPQLDLDRFLAAVTDLVPALLDAGRLPRLSEHDDP